MTKVLLIEDEEALIVILKYNLEKLGFIVDSVSDGKNALEAIISFEPDVVLLDWMLPHVSGVDICKALRRNHDWRYIPVIMLTARSCENDKVDALCIGADDYMTKPFSVPELVARIKALLRRAPPKPQKGILSYADITVDFQKKSVFRKTRLVNLGPTEFRLLEVLIQSPEKVFTREELLKKVWGNTIHVELRTIDVHIKRLRQALNASKEKNIIRTVRSTGYALSCDAN